MSLPIPFTCFKSKSNESYCHNISFETFPCDHVPWEGASWHLYPGYPGIYACIIRYPWNWRKSYLKLPSSFLWYHFKNLSSSYPFFLKKHHSFLEIKKSLIIIIILLKTHAISISPPFNHGSRKVAAKISKILLASVTWMEVIPSQIIALWLQLMSTSGPGDFLFRDFSGIVFVVLFPAVIYLYIVGSPTWSEHMSLSINIYIELHRICKMYMYIYNILYGCKVHLVSNSRHIPKKQWKHQ